MTIKIITQQILSRTGMRITDCKMNDVILQRITDVELAEFCEKYDLELRQITPHQLRIENLIDFYPKRNRYFVINKKRWGTAKTIDDLRNELMDALPEAEHKPKVDIAKLKEWYYHLCKLPHSDFTQGQLTMLSNVLQMVLTDVVLTVWRWPRLAKEKNKYETKRSN